MIGKKILGFCLPVLVLLMSAGASAADPAAQADAERHFKAGVAYMDDPSGTKFEEAFREFVTAYSVLQSHMILMNIGYCALQLERDAEAIEAYTQFLEKASPGDLNPRQRKQMESDIQMLSASLVTVTLQTTPPSVTIVDERFPTKGPTIVNRYQITSGHHDLGVHPGNHRITVTAARFEPQSWEFEAQPASKHVHQFQLVPVGAKPTAGIANEPTTVHANQPPSSTQITPTAATQRPVPESVYLGAAVTGLFVVGTTVTGILALSKKSDFNNLNRDGLRPGDAKSARDRANQYVLFSNIGLGAAILSAGVSTYLYMTRPTEGPKHRIAQSNWGISPSFGRNQADLTVSGTF